MSKLSLKSGVVKDIIIVAVGIAIIWIGLRVAFGTENPFYVVSSGSMIPNLEIFDVIVVQGHVNFDQLKVGDIIVFNRPDGHDKVIVHRVAEILNKDPLVIRTKGDANPGSIPGTDFPITKGDYIGKVVYVIPQIGYVTRILTPPINYIIIAVIVGIMLVKQFGKPKSDIEKLSDDNIDKTKNSDETTTKSDIDQSLSSDKSYLTENADLTETKTDNKTQPPSTYKDPDSKI
ncbi:MAG TPA: signal peptidase I [Candidatus Nitrosotalea sp.]|nr:signal peptidase I [Candidatus Nitrosotalea sp.]